MNHNNLHIKQPVTYVTKELVQLAFITFISTAVIFFCFYYMSLFTGSKIYSLLLIEVSVIVLFISLYLYFRKKSHKTVEYKASKTLIFDQDRWIEV
ncbi:MAG TPA: hypothetical protein VNB90_15920 [Cytophagaceae bacterium]|nr:hypothetical protein [Cytophagaceae bacterium]